MWGIKVLIGKLFNYLIKKFNFYVMHNHRIVFGVGTMFKFVLAMLVCLLFHYLILKFKCHSLY